MLNKPKTVLSFLATALITIAFCAQGAQAVPLGGTIEFVGFGSITSTNGNTTTIELQRSNVDRFRDRQTIRIRPEFRPLFSQSTIPAPGRMPYSTGSVSPLWTFNLGATIYSFDANRT